MSAALGRIIGAMKTKAHGPGSVGFRACGLVALVSSMNACASGGPRAHTTFLDSVDLVAMTDQMASSLASNDAVAARSPDDEPWVVSISRIVNHTNQIIPEREKWLYVGRLRAVLGATAFAKEREIVWIMPPHRWALVQDELGPPPLELRMTPTHELTAEFAALTNTSGRGRSDTYLCEYQLVDLESGRIVWGDHWEVKRSASGLTYD